MPPQSIIPKKDRNSWENDGRFLAKTGLENEMTDYDKVL
jgi:hypothetical protein